jgi:hypothetical protein
MKFRAEVEITETHDGRYYVMLDSGDFLKYNQRSSGTSAEDLKDLAEKVGKLVVEHLLEGK